MFKHPIKPIVIGEQLRDARPEDIMSYPIRGDFLIHVDVATILHNRAQNDHKPVAAVRHIATPEHAEVVRELAWNSPSRFVHHDHQKIPGTEIQNWIETDGDLTALRDFEGMSVFSTSVMPRPTTARIRGKWVIHIAAPVLIRNRKEGRNDPVIAVRSVETNWATDVIFCRKVEWDGPTRMVHRPTTPIPGTDGRGVCFVETDADLTLYFDQPEPRILRNFEAMRSAA